MPPAQAQTNPDVLLRDAIAGIAVAAYSHQINVTIHVDNRLPGQLVPAAADLEAFLRRGLHRTIEAGRTSKIALALWLEEAAPDGRVRALLEVCRALDGDTPPVARLADLWALPLDGRVVSPLPGRCDAAAGSVLIPLDFAGLPGAKSAAARWGATFDGRRLMHVRDVLFDRERLRRSMGAINVDLVFVAAPDQAFAMLCAEAAAGRPVDAIILDGHSKGPAAVDLARRIRAEPALVRNRIVLASTPRGVRLPDEDAALFDAIPWSALPWRRLLDVLADLFQQDGSDAAGEGARARAAPDTLIPALAGRRILIAEDVATNQVLLRAMLQPTGAEVETVEDGAALLERHAAAPADLILMDLQMPGMGGIAALRRLRALGPGPGTVPVVALTAYARRTDRRRALEAGMDGYLVKPVLVAEFYELLRRLLPEGEAGE